MFNRNKSTPNPLDRAQDQSVITHLPLVGDGFGTVKERNDVHLLEHRITAAIKQIGGDHHGYELGEGEVVLFTCGRDADELFAAVSECLKDYPLRSGAYAIKRYGPETEPDAREKRVELRFPQQTQSMGAEEWRLTIGLTEPSGAQALCDHLGSSSYLSDTGGSFSVNNRDAFAYASSRAGIEKIASVARSQIATLNLNPTTITIDEWIPAEGRWSGEATEAPSSRLSALINGLLDGRGR